MTTNFSKKIVVSTLTVGLIVSSFAGVPLSNKGLLEKVGISTVHAYPANPLPNTGITDRMKEIHDNIHPDDLASIKAARDNLAVLESGTADPALIAEVWNKIADAKSSTAGDFSQVTPETIFELINNLGIFYYDDGRGLTYALQTQRETLDQLAKLAGYTNGIDDLTLIDAKLFSDAFETAFASQLSNISNLVSLVDATASGSESLKIILKDSLDTVLGNSTLKFSKLFTNITINAEDLATVMNRISLEIDDSERSSIKGIAFAVMKSDATFTQVGSSTSNAYDLQIFKKHVPSALVTVTSSNSNITVTNNATTDYYTLNSSSSGTTLITATIKLPGKRWDGRELVSDISATFFKSKNSSGTPTTTTPTSTSPGGGGVPPATNPTTNTNPGIENALNNVNNSNAVEALNKALEKQGAVDASKTVKIEGGVAKPNFDVKAISEQFKILKETTQLANDKLKEVNPNAHVKAVATLDLGNVQANQIQVPISKDLIDAAKTNGIDALAVKVNGVTLGVSLKEFNSETTISINKEETPNQAADSNQKFASNVYNVEVAGANGFEEKVNLRLPVSIVGLDSELLVVVKIVDGAFQLVGGKYDSEGGYVEALRDSLSSYAVIENKVSFGDVASVQGWAGRQIQVAAAKGIVEGRAASEFVPNEKVTRAEFAKMIAKTFNLEDSKATESFKDVNDADWFKPYVAAAVKAGIVNGRSADEFAPNATVTRAEMATMAARALTYAKQYGKITDADAALKSFADAASINASLKEGVALAAKEGIIIGENDGKFNPGADSTRAQAAVVIYRLLNK